jgi:hypothetical protein
MTTDLLHTFLPVGGFTLGAMIGFGFGSFQDAALRRNQRAQESAHHESGWVVLSSSMQRITFLLIVLMAIQLACPIFFAGETLPWVVSAGVVVGYGVKWLKKQRARTSYSA